MTPEQLRTPSGCLSSCSQGNCQMQFEFFLCETAVPKLFRSVGHVTYHSVRQSSPVWCLQWSAALASSCGCWVYSAHPTQPVCPRERGFRSQQHLPRAGHTARPEPPAFPGEQLGDGMSQAIWGGKNLPCLLGMLKPLPAPLPCSNTEQPYQGCAPMGKGEVSRWLLLSQPDLAHFFGVLGKRVIRLWDAWGCGQSSGHCW